MAAANEPPYLTVGTDVSARYKGAFCEAKVKKVNRLVKCRVIFESNLGTIVLPDDQLRGALRLNSYVEARHPEKNQYFRAIINKIFDYSQYTVVFDDGDETTLRRNSLCLKSGRHFAESDTLDRLPLTNPEHFGIPVLGSKVKRQRRSAPSCSSVDDESSCEGFSPKAKKKYIKKEQESDIAKVVCVDIGDKRKKDSWFPALVVSPSSQETKISPKDQYLVRSFKDGKYYPVKKKEARMFTKEIGAKVESNVLKTAVDKAMQYLNNDEIPPHWDWDTMMSQDVLDDEIKDSEVESSDDEPSEEKDRFVAQLYKFMDERGTPINRAPTISNRDLNLYKLFSIVEQMGGYNRVTNQNKWETVYTKMGLPMTNSACTVQIKKAYKRYLHSFEDFNRKLGCTMVCNTRSGHVRHRSDRNIIMTRKREQNTPLPKSKVMKEVKKTPQDKAKSEESSERMVWSRSMARAEEAEKQKKAKASESKLEKIEKMETRGSIKTDQEKPKESKGTPNKEKGKKDATVKTKEEKTKDKSPKNNGKELDRTPKGNGKEADKTPKSNGKEVERTPKSNGKEADRAPKSNGKEFDRTPKGNGKEADRTPKSNGKEVDRTPKSNGKEADRTPKSSGKEADKLSKNSGKEADRTLKSNGKEAEKEKPAVMLSPPKIKLEDEKEQQAKAKVEKSEDKEHTEKPLRSKESESKPKRNETNVRIGDRVKVKYGRGKQHKMYEAKVLKIERENGERKFYVHYTGWNTRYDEWIKKGRIIEVVEGKSLTTKNPKRSHSWQESQTKAILKRSMLFASPRKHCSSSSKCSSGITLRARRQDSAPELRQINLNESRKLRSQLSEEPHSSESSDKASPPKSSSESLLRTSPLSDETDNSTSNKPIKLEDFSDPEKNVAEEGISDLIKEEAHLDVTESVDMEEDMPLSLTEIACKKEVIDNAETVKSTDVVLKACTVNLSQENRKSIFPSDSSSKDDDSDECSDIQMKPIKTEPLDDYPDLPSLSKCSEAKEDNFSIGDQSIENAVDENNSIVKLEIPTFCDTSHCQMGEEEYKIPLSVVDNDCLAKAEDLDAKEHNNVTSESQNEEDSTASLDRSNILSEIAEQLVDLNKTASDNLLSDEDLPPPLDIKPDLLSSDCEREVYETQPELKRAISEVEEAQETVDPCTLPQSTQDVCDKSELESVQDKEVDVVSTDVESGDSNVHSSPEYLIEELVANINYQEKRILDLKDEANEPITSKKEKKRSKVTKNEVDSAHCGEETNETNDSINNKNCKNIPKKKFDSTHDDGEIKKKSKKMKDKKKKLKKHKNLKGGDEKDGTKESQDGNSAKKEKKKKDDKAESTVSSVLGQKKGEISKKLKKCRKNKDKSSPRKNDSLTEKKIKRKKKKKDTGLIEPDEKGNDQATSDSDKGTKIKKGKKKDKKKSKKKIFETLELLDKVMEETTDIPDEKIDSKDEKGEKLEDPDTTLESDEKIKEDEISFLLCQEQVPASPLGNEFVEQESSSFALSGSEQNEMSVQPAIESSSYISHSYSTAFPSLHAENIHPLINKHTEMLTVLENTPPTTPESTGTLFSTSPSYDQEMLSPSSSIPHKDSPETENENSREEISNMDITESEDSRTESAILFLANQAVSRKKVLPCKRPAENSDILPPRKKKATKFYSSEPISKPKSSSRATKGEQKDCDASVITGNSNNDSSSSTTTSRQPARTPRFNFYVPLDDTMDSDKRIAIIQNSLAELRKTYMALKAEVAMIDRHRKKAKRKEKEQATASAASAVNSSAQKDGSDTS